MIEFLDIDKSFGKNHVLKGLELVFPQSGVSAVIGPNGSGKTTLIKSLIGLVQPDSGTIKISGQNILGQSQYRNRICYLPQIARFPENLSCRQIIRMIEKMKSGVLRSSELIKRFDFENELDKKISHLSGGNKQKLNLILSLMYDNSIIILDEPNNALDPVSMIKLKELIKEEKNNGKLVILTSHVMSLVEEVASDLVFILEGKIYYHGKLKDLLSQYNTSSLEEATAAILTQNSNKKKNAKNIPLQLV